MAREGPGECIVEVQKDGAGGPDGDPAGSPAGNLADLAHVLERPYGVGVIEQRGDFSPLCMLKV